MQVVSKIFTITDEVRSHIDPNSHKGLELTNHPELAHNSDVLAVGTLSLGVTADSIRLSFLLPKIIRSKLSPPKPLS